MAIRKAIAGIVVVAILFSLVILYKRDEERRLARQAAELTWHEFLTQFQKEVPLETARAEVEKYLDVQKVRYSEGRNFTVSLGQTPSDGIVCDYWKVYASFESGHVEAKGNPSPSDDLTAISLHRAGHCL